MDSLFEIATKMATLPSLAGLIVMVMFLLYRQIIADPLAVQLNRSQAFHTLSRVIGTVTRAKGSVGKIGNRSPGVD